MGPRLAHLPEPDENDDSGAGAHDDELTTPAMDRLREIEAGMAAELGQPDDGRGAAAADGPVPAAPPSREHLRIIEALLFAASEPLDEASLAHHLKGAHDIALLLATLQEEYAGRGVNLVRVAGKWAFRTASDLSWLLERHAREERKLSRAALETLSIIAYHQPVTRAEIEDIRGVTISKGTLDVLLETGWVRPRGRRRAPGKPITYGTTPAFLEHFGLDAVSDLPGLAELKAAGLLDSTLPPGFSVPSPTDVAQLMPDELPLESGDDAPVQAEMELEELEEPREEDAAGDDKAAGTCDKGCDQP